MFSTLFPVIAPVFICAAVGFIWTRSGRAYDTEMVTTLMVVVATPCLLFSALTTADLDLNRLGEMAFAALAAFGAFIVLGGIFLRVVNLPIRGFLPSLMFPNTGNMGLPLCLLAFGEEGLALAVVYFTISAGAQFVLGPAIAAGSFSLRSLATNPMIIAVAAAMAFIFSETSVPAWIANTTDLIGGMTIPMMLVTLGVALARLHIRALGRAAVISAARLALGLGVGIGLAALLGLEGTAKGVFILECAMPVAVFNYLFAQRYKAWPEDVAGAIMISTAISFLTLPALVWYVMQVSV